MKIGSHHSKETRATMSAMRKGKVTWNKGIPMSAETKAKQKIGIANGVYKLKTCLVCGQEYRPIASRQKYCTKCGLRYRTEYLSAWQRANPDSESTEVRAAYRKKYPRRAAEWAKKNPERTSISRRKHSAKRRMLGLIALNAPFVGCEGHHLDRERVIYVPKILHRSISHNQWTGRNMDKINALALQWLAEFARAPLTREGRQH